MPPNSPSSPLKSFISPNSFLHIPPSQSPPSPSNPNNNTNNLIFLIPGNPGLISYYHTFLCLLSDPSTSSAVVAGFSLGGFEISESLDTRTGVGKGEDGVGGAGCEGGGDWEAKLWSGGAKDSGPRGPLYGLREQIELTVRRVEELVRTVMGKDAPDEAVATTVAFLRSENGVRECLAMAKDEMREIGKDRWGEEVWGFVGYNGSKEGFEDGGVEKLREPAKLVFYFAEKDHWIADQTREAIISTRGGTGEKGGPKMIVAEEGDLVHGWCIRQSGHVARKVVEWVEEIVMRK